MSRVDELIEELCPDGVEYKPLSEIATITRGGSLQKKDFTESGVPCIHYGQIYTKYGLFTDKTLTFVSETTALRQKKAVTGDIVMAVTSENIEDVCKCVVWLGEEVVAVSGHTAIIHHNQDAKYLAYFFHSSMFFAQKQKLAHGTKVIEVTPDKLNGVIVPVPPLPVQREIVRILDNFTELTAELTAELTTELTARKKQYEYYRDKMLSFGTEIKMLSLADVTNSIASGKNKERLDDGAYPVYGSTGIISYTNTPVYDWRQILVARVGANAGYINLADGQYDVSDNTLIVDVKKEHSLKYVYYQLQSMNLNQYTKGGGQPLITAGELKKLSIPMPKRDVQNRIVSVLDNFDAICSDLNIGLPAEIEARQKQYEYYRDKLLSFKEV